MQVKYFTYTKANGDQSKRAVVVSGKPTQLLSGTDVSELADRDIAAYVAALNNLIEVHNANVAALQDTFNLNDKYRQFVPERMSDVADAWM